MSWLKPRSIRGQLISRLILFESLLVIVFAILLVREQASEIRERARQRLQSEVKLLALESQDALVAGEASYLEPILRAMANSPFSGLYDGFDFVQPHARGHMLVAHES